MRQSLPVDRDLALSRLPRLAGAPLRATIPAAQSSAPAVEAAPPSRAPTPSPPGAPLWDPPVPTFTYLAGPAGSGKTFAAKAWAERDPRLLIVGTTGIASVNCNTETINAVLGYFDTKSLEENYINGSLTARLGKLWKAGIQRLVIDEVSMMPAEQLTYLARAVNELNGRGYVIGKRDNDDDSPPPAMGLTLVGDFLQLGPVKARYAFESEEWEKFAPNIITLTEIHRQADPELITMLRAARVGRGAEVADYFQARNAIFNETDDRYEGTTILAKNDSVDRYNALRLGQLHGKDVSFLSTRWGRVRSEWGALDKPPNTWGIPQELKLKIGSLVMILNNQRDELRRLIYVNGDLGTIVDATDTTAWVELQRTGETIEVVPVTRQVRVPCDSTRRKELRETGQSDRIDGKWEILGEITYLPLRIAYASTTHKSQGLSLDRAQINIRDVFFRASGMLYVALSRARTMEGLRLVGSPRAIVDRCTTNPRLKDWL